jgi:small-conductance mechanosensitive channel
MRRAALSVLPIILVFAGVVAGQKQPVEGKVRVNGKDLFALQSGREQLTAAERADAINHRLRVIANSPPVHLQTRVAKSDAGWQVLIGNEPVVTVTDDDAKALGTTSEQLAYQWASVIQEAMSPSLGAGGWRELLRRAIYTALILIAAVGLVILLGRARKYLSKQLEARREKIPAVRFRGLQLISPQSIHGNLARLLSLLYLAGLVVVAVAALLLVFAQIPETRGYTYQVLLWLWDPLLSILKGVLSYLPNLFYILVIVAVTRVALRAIAFVFDQAHRGVISLEPWVHRDVARPTAQIIKAVVIVLALFFVAPLIPGTGSTAARGITVILGLMVSFGSSSTVGNLIAGIVLTYMRPFQIGERVKIGDTVGDVVERTFLYIKIRTIKNEQVIVPSLLALNNTMINYSAETRVRGLILHTTVTISYDAPWRKVHELLEHAAMRTESVLKDPEPFVLQTSLNDFFVSYQLNVYTDKPTRMAQIYSDLHQHIQDAFNQGGIEILSPHYTQLRDGNTTTIPAEYRPEKYRPGRFLVDTSPAKAQP